MMRFKPALCAALLFVTACSKSDDTQPAPGNNTVSGTKGPVLPKAGANAALAATRTNDDGFVTWIIRKGENYAENNSYPLCTLQSLKFKAIFDSSCIYTNVDPVNQADINKLYGFADSMTHHQRNSARFGWNWMNGQIHIHAYCYVSTVRMYKELGTVPLNKEVNCSIDVLPGKYIFTLNGKKDTMQRACMDPLASGYKLFPYFGGDEPAPHDIRIKIREIN